MVDLHRSRLTREPWATLKHERTNERPCGATHSPSLQNLRPFRGSGDAETETAKVNHANQDTETPRPPGRHVGCGVKLTETRAKSQRPRGQARGKDGDFPWKSEGGSSRSHAAFRWLSYWSMDPLSPSVKGYENAPPPSQELDPRFESYAYIVTRKVPSHRDCNYHVGRTPCVDVHAATSFHPRSTPALDGLRRPDRC